MITVEHLVYEYPTKRALHDVSFAIEEGSITALVGPNGAGKTTLLRCMAALEPPFSGRVLLHGMDTVEEPRKVHENLGYLQDLFGLYDTLSVQQCLTFAGLSHNVSRSDIKQRVKEVAIQLGLADRMEMKAGQLSRGLRQRLAIGQAIIHHPKILLLDEPASGLDPEARVDLSTLLLQLRSEGITLVVSSHILAELEEYSTHMLVIRDGRIEQHQGIKELQEERRRIQLRCCETPEHLTAALSALDTISDLHTDGMTLRFRFAGDRHEQHQLLKRLLDAGYPIYEFGEVVQNLQDMYLEGTRNEGANP